MTLLFEITGGYDSGTIRAAAESQPFDPESVVHVGPLVGYVDAPHPTTADVIEARDSVVADLEAEYPVSIRPLSMDEQEAFMIDRYGDPTEDGVTWPSWYHDGGTE